MVADSQLEVGPEAIDDTAIVDANKADLVGDADGAADQEPEIPPIVCPWEPYDEGLLGGPVVNVQFDPRVPGSAYATTGSLIFHSLDSGESWERLSDDPVIIDALGFPVDDIKKFLSISTIGLGESRDFAQSFEVKALGGLKLTALLVHPAASQRVFVGTLGAGILRSDDTGDSWVPHNSGVPFGSVLTLAGDPRDTDAALAGLGDVNPKRGGILRTTDGGREWQTVLDGFYVRDIDYCPANPDIVYAAVTDSVARSDDGGATWTLLPITDTLPSQVAVSHQDCDVAYTVGLGAGPGALGGFHRTDDGFQTTVGPTYDGLNVQRDRLNLMNLVVDPRDDSSLFAPTHGGLYKSEDAGASWSLRSVAEGIPVVSMVAAPADPARLWLTTWGSGAWTRPSADHEWTRVGIDQVPRDFTFRGLPHPYDPDRVWVSAFSDLYESRDGGETFDQTDVPGNTLGIGVLTDPDELLAVGQKDGVFRSVDDGLSWTMTENLGIEPWMTSHFPSARDVRQIMVTPEMDDRVIIGTGGSGIYRSDDRAQTWVKVAPTLADEFIRILGRYPGPPEALFALVDDQGVFRSDDGGDTWRTSNSGLESLNITDMVVDEETGKVYVSTAFGTVFRSDDGLSWSPFDRFCLPREGFGAVAITDDGVERWLVVVGGNNSVYRHRL